MTATLNNEVRKLSVAEKIQLAEDLWDEIAAAGDDLPVPEAHKRLLEARLAAHLESPDSALTLEEFRQQLAPRLFHPPAPSPNCRISRLESTGPRS